MSPIHIVKIAWKKQLLFQQGLDCAIPEKLFLLHPRSLTARPWKWWLEAYFPIGKETFQGRAVKLWEGRLSWVSRFSVYRLPHHLELHFENAKTPFASLEFEAIFLVLSVKFGSQIWWERMLCSTCTLRKCVLRKQLTILENCWFCKWLSGGYIDNETNLWQLHAVAVQRFSPLHSSLSSDPNPAVKGWWY